jgi:hypothetical protein
LKVHGVNYVRQTEIHTAEPLVLEPSAFEVEIAIEKLKGHISPGIYQIPAELIKAGGRTIRSEIHKLINPLNSELSPICHLLALLGAHHIFHVSRIRVNSIWNKKILAEERNESIVVSICTKGN